MSENIIHILPETVANQIAAGEVVQRPFSVNDAAEAVYDMEYDTYGNVTKFTRPENNNGERVSVSVKYDDTHHLFPTEVSDSYGFTSYTEYDKIFGLPIKQTDINGATIEYSYDKKGRLTTLTAPKEAEKGEHTLKFEYILEEDNYKGITHHNTPEGGFEVYSYIDSLGREKYTETISNIYENGELSTKTIRSAYTKYDAFSRKVEQIKACNLENISLESGVETFSLHCFDELDRPVLSTFIDGSEVSMQYKIDTEEQTGKTTLICTTTDAEGRISNTYTDALGRTIATENIVNGEPIRVVNTYDVLSRVVEVLHPNEHISTYKYDMLGNIIETKTPDAGTVTAEYTPQGQVLSRTTANGEVVSYNYDFERLKSVAYSLHPNDSIVYTYGDTLAENFQKGRLLSVTYPMGSEEYTYGNMGEVVKTVKSIVIDEQIDKIHSYTSEFEYDSWNRIQKMIYPDGEVVDYEYYSNGELKSITGEKDGITYSYLVETGYNANGQTAYRLLGNGSEQRYFYDKKDRLQTSTLHIGSERISVNTYNYDKVDNITSIHDNGIYFQNYTYDELNRLVSANGYDFGTIGDTPNSYNMTMEYNKMSSPVVFNQSISTDKGTTFKNNTYLYNQELQPNAPVQIGDMHYTYDAAGNPTSILDAGGMGRDMIWDAENRLKEIIDTKEGLFHSYAYDHTGERILKRYGTAQSGYVNGKDMGTLYDFGESYSAYASAYFVENNTGYTKHYYAGATRLVSKLGEGYFENNELVPTGKEEKEQYFYFQDHLGSSTYITDINGEIAQYSAYTPYGEMFCEYRNVTPYRFNGKELDTETGLYYYGARYYNPATALWLGVDPLASKYPGVSPYVYCVGNPVKYVDPDGRVPALVIPLIKGAVGASIDMMSQISVSIANGKSFKESMKNLDLTSIGTSFIVSAISAPGMSTVAKIVTNGLIALDATIDISANDGVSTILPVENYNNKETSHVIVDAVSSFIPGKIVDDFTSALSKAISSDLTSKASATLTKESINSMKKLHSDINSTGFQIGSNAIMDYWGGYLGGSINNINKPENEMYSVPRSSSQLNDNITLPNDATRVNKIFIYE